MSVKSALRCFPVGHGSRFCLNSPSCTTAISSLTFLCFTIPVCEPDRPTVRATQSLCFPVFMPFLGDSLHFECFCLLYVSILPPSETQFQHSLHQKVLSLPHRQRHAPYRSVRASPLPVSFCRVECLCLCLSTSPSPVEHFLRTGCQTCIPSMHQSHAWQKLGVR